MGHLGVDLVLAGTSASYDWTLSYNVSPLHSFGSNLQPCPPNLESFFPSIPHVLKRIFQYMS